MENQFIKNSFLEAEKILNNFHHSEENISSIDKAINFLVDSFKKNGKAISVGNGGSMCDAMHFAEELTGRFKKDRPALPAIAVSDPSHLSCVANDYGYEFVFSRAVEAWGSSHDTLLAISTSGNSENVLKACQVARQKGMKIVALLGRDGGKIKSIADISLIVPHHNSDRTQEIHIKIIHIMIEGVERRLFPELYT